jgi:hypothetical protein
MIFCYEELDDEVEDTGNSDDDGEIGSGSERDGDNDSERDRDGDSDDDSDSEYTDDSDSDDEANASDDPCALVLVLDRVLWGGQSVSKKREGDPVPAESEDGHRSKRMRAM